MKNRITCINCGYRLFDLDGAIDASGNIEIKCTRCKRIIDVSLRDVKITVKA